MVIYQNGMSVMFMSSKFNSDISKWDVHNVTDIKLMFFGSKFNNNISSWNVSNVNNISNMFTFCNIKDEYRPKYTK